jgi:hypothetical protein
MRQTSTIDEFLHLGSHDLMSDRGGRMRRPTTALSIWPLSPPGTEFSHRQCVPSCPLGRLLNVPRCGN